MIIVTEKFICDFCAAENIESQFKKVEIRGNIYGPEMACPNCLKKILDFLTVLKCNGPQPQAVEEKSLWKSLHGWPRQ